MEKAIFKFNGGLGALLCSKCRTIIKTGSQMTDQEKNAMKGLELLPPAFCSKCATGVHYVLTRVEDGLMFNSCSVKWVKWKEDGRFEKLYARPKIGFSCIVDPEYGSQYTWLTTTIESMTKISANELQFKTKNSTYILNKIKNGKS
jgi:hypothetical protein